MSRARVWRRVVAVVAMAGSAFALSARPGDAAPPPLNLPVVPQVVGNPNPGTDLFASTIAVGTGGTQRDCAVSPLGIVVRCVENVNIQPSGSPTASGTTYAHWVFCRTVCTPSLLAHELVHVAQFEEHGDLFGPMYLAEAAVHGTGCENKYEKPAYQVNGQCMD